MLLASLYFSTHHIEVIVDGFQRFNVGHTLLPWKSKLAWLRYDELARIEVWQALHRHGMTMHHLLRLQRLRNGLIALTRRLVAFLLLLHLRVLLHGHIRLGQSLCCNNLLSATSGIAVSGLGRYGELWCYFNNRLHVTLLQLTDQHVICFLHLLDVFN